MFGDPTDCSLIITDCLDSRRTYSTKFTIAIRLELYAQLQLFSFSNNQPLYHLQRERQGALAFCAAAPTVWNSLGVHTRSADTFLTLKNRLKIELFIYCYS